MGSSPLSHFFIAPPASTSRTGSSESVSVIHTGSVSCAHFNIWHIEPQKMFINQWDGRRLDFSLPLVKSIFCVFCEKNMNWKSSYSEIQSMAVLEAAVDCGHVHFLDLERGTVTYTLFLGHSSLIFNSSFMKIQFTHRKATPLKCKAPPFRILIEQRYRRPTS